LAKVVENMNKIEICRTAVRSAFGNKRISNTNLKKEEE
jgi:hypothetical protein